MIFICACPGIEQPREFVPCWVEGRPLFECLSGLVYVLVHVVLFPFICKGLCYSVINFCKSRTSSLAMPDVKSTKKKDMYPTCILCDLNGHKFLIWNDDDISPTTSML